jgi:wyosine [tRNA(Phe)-imidazoG37] synthetase (radical SAM superfamily)
MAKRKYLFGPVPSRRLGRSLGVDIVPLKACSQNCIYCQLGINADTTIERGEYVDIDQVLAELKAAVDEGLQADYITLTGSGEPTLNSRIGELIDGIRKITNIPIAILTNGNLFFDSQVRAACCKADVVSPSLDAGDAKTFAKMNRSHESINFDDFLDALCDFRKEYTGQVWLEVFFCQGVNTDDAQVQKMRSIIERIAPDRIQLNTSVRPTVEKDAVRVDQDRLEQIASMIGGNAEVIADFSRIKDATAIVSAENVIEMLRRRPCTIEDIANGLSAQNEQIAKIVEELTTKGLVEIEQKDSDVYYSAKDASQ